MKKMAYPTYIWQRADWPAFRWDAQALIEPLARVSARMGRLAGQMSMLGFGDKSNAQLEVLTRDLLSSAEIEGVILNADSVRSSVARKLGIDLSGAPATDHYVEGLVDALLDAVGNADKPLTEDRLFGWHAALFPYGRSGMYAITVADWRHGDEPMRVVSGAFGHERVHFEAPPSECVGAETRRFIDWANESADNPILKSAIAHLWFVTIHPFDDGNGRISRTIADMMLARGVDGANRYFSMSAEILREKKSYYEVLERTQKGDLDITEWLLWYIKCLGGALEQSGAVIERTLRKAAFWERFRDVEVNERQRKVLNRLWDGFEGKLTTVKWAKICHTGRDTALRDIQDLIAKGMMRPSTAGGRSTSYEISN